MTATLTRNSADAVDAADDHPFVVRVREYADAVLRPTALDTDRLGVGPDRIEELRELGLLNHLAPVDRGGQAADRSVDRRVHEILAGACLNTWLVWAQHAPLVGRLAARAADGPGPGLFGRVVRGELMLGAAISDVRRYPDRFVAATRAPGGWTFAGTVSWVTGWGLNSALTVAAVEPDTDTVVTALVPITGRLRATPVHLSAVGGSRTDRVLIDRVIVPDEHELGTVSNEQRRHDDLGTASDARPHHFGLARTVLRELEESTRAPARAVAAAWRPRIAEIRSRAYQLADEAAAAGGGRHRLDERLATKVASGEALSTITRALLVARSGRGLAGDDTAQLYARSALFVLVLGQSADVRDAQLSELAQLARRPDPDRHQPDRPTPDHPHQEDPS
jgi:alkylation response protein AidB-like acyl-CoA dehydrogenase